MGFQLIEQLIEFLQTPFDILLNFLRDIVYVVKLCTSVLANARTFFYFLPAAAGIALVTLLGIVVAYKIVGRT